MKSVTGVSWAVQVILVIIRMSHWGFREFHEVSGVIKEASGGFRGVPE